MRQCTLTNVENIKTQQTKNTQDKKQKKTQQDTRQCLTQCKHLTQQNPKQARES